MNLSAVVRLIQRRVSVRAEEYIHTDHTLFLNRVDRRVGHLRKELLKIVKQRLRALRKHRNRRVVAHGANGVQPRLRDGQHGEHAVFIRPAEDVLQHGRVFARLALALVVRFLQLDDLLLEPLLPRAVEIAILDRLILQQFACFGVQ